MKVGDTVKIIQKTSDEGKIGKVLGSCPGLAPGFFYIENCKFTYCDSQVKILETKSEELIYEVW